jgi:hypothetical protein
MASLRADATFGNGGQGIIKTLKIASCVTGDTVAWDLPMKGFIPVNESTSDAVTATYDTTTQLFTITVANTPNIAIHIIQ